jgi:hypothetical protein
MVLGLLASSDLPSLRPFWLKIQAQPGVPADVLPIVARGIVATGSEADILALTGKLGAVREVDLAVLQALQKRPIASARPQVAALFQDHKASADVRVYALRVLLVPSEGRDALISQALHDPAAEVRIEALLALSRRPTSASAPVLRALLADPSPGIRQTAARQLQPFADESDVPRLAALLIDSEPHVREAAGAVLLARWGPRPGSFSGYPTASPLSPPNPMLFRLAAIPGHPVSTAPGILLELGRSLVDRGEFGPAERHFRSAITAATAPKFPASPSELHSGASARFELAHLLLLQGREAGALEQAAALEQCGESENAIMRDYPLIGSTRDLRARELGAQLRSDLTANPLRLRVTRMPSDAEGIERYKVTVTNVGKTEVRLLVHRDAAGGVHPARSVSVVNGIRHWLNGEPDSETKDPVPLVLEPGMKLSGTIRARTGATLAVNGRVDVITQATVLAADDSQQKVWLRGAIASTPQ